MNAWVFWLMTCFASISYGLVMDKDIDRICAPIYWVGFALLCVRWMRIRCHD